MIGNTNEMKKLIYITTKDFSNGKGDGVVKKILDHIKSFKDTGFSVDYTYIDSRDKSVHFVVDGKDVSVGRYKILGGIFTKVTIYKYLLKLLRKKTYDCAYIRFLGGRTDPWHIDILRILKQYNIKTLLEIPTFPYDEEGSKLETYIDRCFRGFLKKYVDRVVTHYKTDTIYGIETILTKNGIFVDEIKTIASSKHDELNFIAVASFEVAHGYERFIKSLERYEDSNPVKKVIVHMVGEGIERKRYEQLAKDCNVSDYFIFYGRKEGKELDDIYDKADVAIGCLGLYKKGLDTVSSLKSVEYISKGLPVVNGFEEEMFITNKDFVCEFDNDDSLIDIEKIVKWYDKLILQYGNKENLTNCIHKYARENVDISVVMKPIIDYIK